jgi:hypothetical protein
LVFAGHVVRSDLARQFRAQPWPSARAVAFRFTLGRGRRIVRIVILTRFRVRCGWLFRWTM